VREVKIVAGPNANDEYFIRWEGENLVSRGQKPTSVGEANFWGGLWRWMSLNLQYKRNDFWDTTLEQVPYMFDPKYGLRNVKIKCVRTVRVNPRLLYVLTAILTTSYPKRLISPEFSYSTSYNLKLYGNKPFSLQF
jgi:hypothetical protein